MVSEENNQGMIESSLLIELKTACVIRLYFICVASILVDLYVFLGT